MTYAESIKEIVKCKWELQIVPNTEGDCTIVSVWGTRNSFGTSNWCQQKYIPNIEFCRRIDVVEEAISNCVQRMLQTIENEAGVGI